MPRSKRRRVSNSNNADGNDISTTIDIDDGDNDGDNVGTNEIYDQQNNINIAVIPGDNVTSYIEKSTKPVLCHVHDDTQQEVARKTLIGTGLRYDTISKQVYATIAGRISVVKNVPNHNSHENTNSVIKLDDKTIATYFIEPHRPVMRHKRRYIPMLHDRVIGIVIDRIGTSTGTTTKSTDNSTTESSTSSTGGGDIYRVDINASHYAMINNLHFMNASKRNKPQLQRGQVIYCRIVDIPTTGATISTTISSSNDIILSCINGPYDVGIPNKDWTTNEGCYGIVGGSGGRGSSNNSVSTTCTNGTLCRVSLQLARDLLLSQQQQQHFLGDKCSMNAAGIVLDEMSRHSKKIPFEIAIGQNGYMYLNSTTPEYIICIQNALYNSQVLSKSTSSTTTSTPEQQIRAMVKKLIYVVEKQIQQSLDRST